MLKHDANSETFVREVDSETLFETDSEFKTDSDALAETDALDSGLTCQSRS